MSSEQGTVSAASSAAPSPQPLHNPAQAAVVHIPEAPLGNHTNNNAAMGQKALLAKKMVKRSNPSIVSPTDKLMTPVTAKLSQAKKKHFSNSVKPLSFGSKLTEGGSTADIDD
ncbi:hypothetical protein BS47DRAFT_1310977 [Hydnum rufescens UP504]|uniref:Spo12 n=1 Tax=Hydnum rufescens UP504 TaxID=1448309 RepID=A0A9P6BB80_9AGAM|nr:hypothetical protein BS47DRAFT_1310977 [Hydnum rufescens UP504]